MEITTKDGMTLIKKEDLDKIKEIKNQATSVILSISITWRKIERLEKLIKDLG